MTDQQRFDTLASLGNPDIYTPNLDRLVQRGVAFRNAYSTCPVCVPARYTIRTGRDPASIRWFSNGFAGPVSGQPEDMEERCGPYLARTMAERGYRTFGVGKFHTKPWNEDVGYETQLHAEELYDTPEQREGDAYAAWLHREHPEYDHLETLMGERTEMYYMPQMSAQPAEAAMEGWAAARAVEQIAVRDERPYFGFVSLVGPHPPLAPPIPYNRMYDPDRMPNPVKGGLETDHMDQYIPHMNRIIWADEINDALARVLKARYYGEISYIDHCLGQILDAVEASDDADNTLICFYSDHGEHLGDHHAWQKESFFEASAHVPFLLSWPDELSAGEQREELVCLTDLFGLATGASGRCEPRDGMDLLGLLQGSAPPRDALIGMHGIPGTEQFKIMVRQGPWKYIYFANGGKQQLFHLDKDPDELSNRVEACPDKVSCLHAKAVDACRHPGAQDALDGDELKVLPYSAYGDTTRRVYQFDLSRGIQGFPDRPGDLFGDD